MSSTYLALNAHIIFSTKGRTPNLINLNDIHAYMGGIVRTLGAIPVQVGGVEDHVHLLIGFKATHSIANIVQEVKKRSTQFIREEVKGFEWQIGYAAYTISPERMSGVIKYIANQREHHATTTFEEERLILLKLAGVEFDPKYMD